MYIQRMSVRGGEGELDAGERDCEWEERCYIPHLLVCGN